MCVNARLVTTAIHHIMSTSIKKIKKVMTKDIVVLEILVYAVFEVLCGLIIIIY